MSSIIFLNRIKGCHLNLLYLFPVPIKWKSASWCCHMFFLLEHSLKHLCVLIRNAPHSCITRHGKKPKLKLIRVISVQGITAQQMIHARDHIVCSNPYRIWIRCNPGLTVKAFIPDSWYLSSPGLPAGPDVYPAVGVNTNWGAQHHRLGAQVVCHLDVSVHDGEGDVVGALHTLPTPQHQALGRLCPDA